ncbi:hypothetical protein GYMLUDRAFT_181115, partial [Collybiopsis luxurians FD-317 M1]
HSESQCFCCGEKGHLVHNCPKPHQTVVQSLEVNPESNDRGMTSLMTNIWQMFLTLDKEQQVALAKELGLSWLCSRYRLCGEHFSYRHCFG